MEVAYMIYPLPNGRVRTEEDLRTPDDVERLFNACQIMEGMISKKGWDFLIAKFGMEGLYEIEQKSCWFNSDSFEEFVADVEYERNKVAYTDEHDHKAITDFCESAHHTGKP